MSVEEPDTIDMVGVESATGKVVLTISDHLDWDNANGHMVALQEKLNTYLRFVESGELVEAYPDASNRAPVIEIAFMVPPAQPAFLAQVAEFIRGAGIEFRVKVVC